MANLTPIQPHNPDELPKDLPVPKDDGACDHLLGMQIPEGVALQSHIGRLVDVAEASRSRAVFFFYPRTGKPGVDSPKGWDQIPGARGCTPESCSYRDHYLEFKRLGYAVYGVSTQSTEDQKEFADRSAIPYEVLSDSKLDLTNALNLPTFKVDELQISLIKRLTLVVKEGRIVKVFYPVFPPDKNAIEVLEYLKMSVV